MDEKTVALYTRFDRCVTRLSGPFPSDPVEQPADDEDDDDQPEDRLERAEDKGEDRFQYLDLDVPSCVHNRALAGTRVCPVTVHAW